MSTTSISSIKSQLYCGTITHGDVSISTYEYEKFIYFIIQKKNGKTFVINSPYNYNKIKCSPISERNIFIKVMKMMNNKLKYNIQFYIVEHDNMKQFIVTKTYFINTFFAKCVINDTLNYDNLYNMLEVMQQS